MLTLHADAVEWLVRALTLDADTVRKHAAAALGTLAFGHDDNMRRVRSAGGEGALRIATLRGQAATTDKARQNALWALSVIASPQPEVVEDQDVQAMGPPTTIEKPVHVHRSVISPFKQPRDAWDQSLENTAQQNIFKSKSGLQLHGTP